MLVHPSYPKTMRQNSLDFQLQRLVQQEIAQRNTQNNSSVNELSSIIPGVRNLLHKRRFIACKILWLIVIITCIGMCTYQTVDRISHYFSYPLKTKIKTEKPTKFSFPAITLCARHSEKITELMDSLENGRLGTTGTCVEPYTRFIGAREGLDAEEYWKLSDALHEFTTTLYANKDTKSDTPVNVTSVDLISGKCFTVEITEDVAFEGHDTMLEIKRRPLKTKCTLFGIMLSFHEPGSFVNIRNCLFADQGAYTQIAINYKRFKRLDTPNAHCISLKEANDCYTNCLLDAMSKVNVTCGFPSMRADHLPSCAEMTDAKKTHAAIWPIMYSADRQHYCNCTPICNEKVYNFVRIPKRFGGNETELNFFYPDNNFHVMEEEYAYTFISLVCDIGGNLGLYLGLSVISFFELCNTAISLCNHQKRK